MKTQTQKEITRHDILDMASKWVDSSFNFIRLNVYEKMADGSLFDYIRAEEPDYQEFVNNYNLQDELDEYKKDRQGDDEDEILKEFCEEEQANSFDRYRSDQERDNYPMWGTVFEWKDEPSETMVQAGIDAGFGVIESMDDFDTTFFVSGAGYSFYGAHWIPLFLAMPWNDELREQAKGLNYSDL